MDSLGIPEGFLAESLRIPWEIPRDSLGNPFGFPKECLGNPEGFLGKPYGFPWDSLGIPLGEWDYQFTIHALIISIAFEGGVGRGSLGRQWLYVKNAGSKSVPAASAFQR